MNSILYLIIVEDNIWFINNSCEAAIKTEILLSYLMQDNKAEQSQKVVKPKDPCRRKQIDFHLCEKQYGFNDSYCKCKNYVR